MQKKISTSLFSFFLLLSVLSAQGGLRLQFGMNVGASQLHHGIRFEDSKLNLHYKSIALTHPEGYTWEQFEENFGLREAYIQPRFGFSAHVSYRNLPVFLIVDAMSSSSSYEKMAYSGTIAMGKNFDIGRTDYFVTALAGYKYVKDYGFGSQTLVNSIGNDEQRYLLSQYFNPEKPLGPQTGNLFVMRLGFGQTFGTDDDFSIGLEAFGELDLTDKTTRQARMTNMGLQAYARFMFELRSSNYYPDPAGGRPY